MHQINIHYKMQKLIIMKQLYFSVACLFILILSSCSPEEASYKERMSSSFTDSLGVDINSQQWWKTVVNLKIDIKTEKPVKLALLSSGTSTTWLYDYKEVESSRTVVMTAPQGQGNTLTLGYLCKGKYNTKEVILSGASEQTIEIDTRSSKKTSKRRVSPAASLYGNSIIGEKDPNAKAKYYQFSDNQLRDFFKMMEFSISNTDAKTLGLNCNYELESRGPFYITWVNGYMGKLGSCTLGYYYHSPETYKDIIYVDISETHQLDYIDGLAKVQYQISRDFFIDGFFFSAYTWYDANFDLTDKFGATTCLEPARQGDDVYNSQEVYLLHKNYISALRGISFKIDVPEGKRIGFYLRSEDESWPEQWSLLNSKKITPYVDDPTDFMGTCYSAEFMNVVGNGGGLHRSFIKSYENVYWMGMEDVPRGGDHDCNDVVFGVVSDLKILMPTIVEPEEPTEEVDINDILTGTVPFPWTVAYEDVNRIADFDFNDAVIKLVPDYINEECCVWVMAAGSTSRMYLHFDGPDGDENLGEVHELLGSKKAETIINTQSAVANTGFVQIDCVPWPKEYTMGQDAKRFYIEIQRGTCDDCTDMITLANEPGQLPEALLVAGEWQWPKEGVHINSAYSDFSKWTRDPSRRWEWYTNSENSSTVTY